MHVDGLDSRLLRHRFQKVPFSCVHTKTLTLRFQKFPLWRPFSKGCVFGERIRRKRVDGRRIRKKTRYVFKRIRVRVDGASGYCKHANTVMTSQEPLAAHNLFLARIIIIIIIIIICSWREWKALIGSRTNKNVYGGNRRTRRESMVALKYHGKTC